MRIAQGTDAVLLSALQMRGIDLIAVAVSPAEIVRNRVRCIDGAGANVWCIGMRANPVVGNYELSAVSVMLQQCIVHSHRVTEQM